MTSSTDKAGILGELSPVDEIGGDAASFLLSSCKSESNLHTEIGSVHAPTREENNVSFASRGILAARADNTSPISAKDSNGKEGREEVSPRLQPEKME
jgi:hypothetical protein